MQELFGFTQFTYLGPIKDKQNRYLKLKGFGNGEKLFDLYFNSVCKYN